MESGYLDDISGIENYTKFRPNYFRNNGQRFNLKESRIRNEKILKRYQQRTEYVNNKDRKNAEKVYQALQTLHLEKLKNKRKEAAKHQKKIDQLAVENSMLPQTLLKIQNSTKFVKASVKNVFIETLKREITKGTSSNEGSEVKS